MEETSLKDTLKGIEGKLDDLTKKKDIKKWNLWSKWKFWENIGKNKVKKNWIKIIYISDNKNLSTLKAQIIENVILIDNVPHVVKASDICLHKGKPTIIQPAWSVQPFSPEQNQKETEENGKSSKGWKYLMNYLKSTEIKSVKNMGTIAWIIGIVLVVGGIYYAIKSGMFS